MKPLQDQTVAVVGARSGIGLAAAREAAAKGARVVMMSRNLAALSEAAAAIEGEVRPVALDMLEPEAVRQAFAALGTIDHLVLTAVANEYALFGPIETLSAAQIERSLDKLRGFIHLIRAAAPQLSVRGSISMLSGAGALKAPRGTSLAAAANGGLVSLGKALALELAPRRVNVVMPGVIDTAIHGDQRKQIAAWAESDALPARRFGQVQDVAQAILFLMTNPYMTGHTLVVDGGYLLT